MNASFDWTQVDHEFWLFMFGKVAFLGLITWSSARLPEIWRSVVRFIVMLIALRLLLFGNPAAWHFYESALNPTEVGWRQSSVIRLMRDHYLKQMSDIKYLAVGSSQTGAIYESYASENPEFGVFSMAAMGPLDFVLYEDYIARYRPKYILLYLSDFDLARQQPPESVAMAPRQGPDIFGLCAKIKSLSGNDYDRALIELLVGELSPEFKYGFVFRALSEKAFTRVANSMGAPEEEDVERTTLEQRIIWMQESFQSDNIPFNLAFLNQFLSDVGDFGARVVIVEGQYNPIVSNPETLRLSESVRSDLQELAANFEYVSFIPRTATYEFSEAEYQDLSHVTRESAYIFVSQLVAALEGHQSNLIRKSLAYQR